MTIATPTILAIDRGKCNSVLCAFGPVTREAAFRTVKTTPDELREALLRQPGGTVVVGACPPAGWVSDLCGELELPVVVANTTGDAWAWKTVKRKPDRDNALKLARLASVGDMVRGGGRDHGGGGIRPWTTGRPRSGVESGDGRPTPRLS